MRLFLLVFTTIISLHPLVAQQQRDVSFTIVEKPPIYPNCKGGNPELLKECFTNNVEQIVHENIDFTQFEKQLPKGIHRVFVTFTINEEGRIIKPKVRSQFPIVQKETIDALGQIPILKPAIHKNQVRATAFATAFSINIKEGIPENSDY